MLEHLFSSKTRVKLLTLFLRNPEKKYYVRELTREIDERINSVRRELENLLQLGLLTDFREDKKRFYKVDKSFMFYKELRSLINKASTMPREEILKLIKKAGKPTLVILSGRFTQSPSKVDLLLVGDFNKGNVVDLVAELETQHEHEVNFSVMKTSEYVFRQEYGDRFLKSVYEFDHAVLLDEMPNKEEGGVKEKAKHYF